MGRLQLRRSGLRPFFNATAIALIWTAAVHRRFALPSQQPASPHSRSLHVELSRRAHRVSSSHPSDACHPEPAFFAGEGPQPSRLASHTTSHHQASSRVYPPQAGRSSGLQAEGSSSSPQNAASRQSHGPCSVIRRVSPPRCSSRTLSCGQTVFRGNFSDHSRITIAGLANTSSKPNVSKS
jgi:hypothetical protein